MPLFRGSIIVLVFSALAVAQGTPPPAPMELAESPAPATQVKGAPPAAPVTTFGHMKSFVKNKINRAIDGKPYPSLNNCQPLTTREKYDNFLIRIYSMGTFAGAGVDALKKDFRDRNREYEPGAMGSGQRFGINLATTESDTFFEKFLVPSILKQDPRYFRNPDLPFFRRAT